MSSNQVWNYEAENFTMDQYNSQFSQIDLPQSDNQSFMTKLRNKERVKYFKKNSLKLDLNKIIGNNNGKWTKTEKLIFIEEFLDNGNEWNRLEDSIKTRNASQIRSHAQKFFERLSKNFSDETRKVIITPDSFSKFIWPLSEAKKESIKLILIKLFHNESYSFNKISNSFSNNNIDNNVNFEYENHSNLNNNIFSNNYHIVRRNKFFLI